ncbi:hypothetical protein ETAA8_53330 [Anatilimnocola aggregata]|uniref:Uncharacterized protein n=1 Tax=Anatilimnocola aggregata TaxID=2528021 RepID=A0A517YJ30_9BACT|nr:hypothetical protein ETAA8_53330 [Anatilimnocola aggregata]
MNEDAATNSTAYIYFRLSVKHKKISDSIFSSQLINCRVQSLYFKYFHNMNAN